MRKIIIERIKQGHQTIRYPDKIPPFPERYRGLLNINYDKCQDGCQKCIDACPTNAINRKDSSNVTVDLGRCLFCRDCESVCPPGAIFFEKEHRMSARSRKDLLLCDNKIKEMEPLGGKLGKLFKRSLKLRQVSAGGCNACEADTNVLNTILYDLGKYGIQFVASPRHADGILVTGPVTSAMRIPLLKTYEAVPDPKIVIVVGACAISGGPFVGHKETNDGVGDLLKVDLFIPGCPPHPLTILDGLLRLISIV